MPVGNTYGARPGGLQGDEVFVVFTTTATYNCTLDEVRAFLQSENVFEPRNTNIQLHISSTSNPHNVTKTQLGLENVTNVDTTNPANITQSVNYRFVTDTEKSTWNGKQDALGFTPENVANKSTNVVTDGSSDTKYPSVKAIKDYADGLVVGLLDDRGNYDASGNVFPSTGGSGTAGAIMKGDLWFISVGGTLGGEAVGAGSSLRALADSPGQTAGNWDVLGASFGYTPENVANKVTSLSNSSTDVQYPSAKLTYDQLALKANLAGAAFTGDVSSTGKITGRHLKNVQSVTTAITFTHNCDSYSEGKITALATDVTMAAPTGTPVDGEKYLLRIKDAGTSKNITWDSAFVNHGGVLPVVTYSGKWHTVGCIYNSTLSKWCCVADTVEV
jgi:hypothetical protein